MKLIVLFILLNVGFVDYNALTALTRQDSLQVPGTKKVRGGGRGDGTGGGQGDDSKPKPLPQKIELSNSSISVQSSSPTGDQQFFNQLIDNARSYRNINYDSGIYYAQLALTESQSMASIEGEIEARRLLVSYYAETANTELGIAEAEALLPMVKDWPNFDLAALYRAMAMMYQVSGNYQNASKYWDQAVSVNIDNEDTLGIITSHIEAGIYYDAIGKYPKALKLLTASLELSRSYGNYVAEHYTLGSIGKVYTHMKDYDNAFKYLEESLRLKQVYFRPVSVAYGFYDLQQAYLQAGKYRKSIAFGKDLQETLNINPGTYLFKHSLEATRKASKALGEEMPALVEDSYLPISDALNNHEHLMQIRQIEALHNNEKTSEFIYKQQSSIGELEATTEFQKKAIYYGVAGLLLLFGSVYMIRSRAFAIQGKKMQEAFTHQLLDYQEQERQRISRDLHDSIGQSLVLIKNKIELNNDSETSTMIDHTLEEVRSISKQLHPVLLEKLGLTASIEKLMEDVDQNSEVFMETEIANVNGIFTREHELHIYRVIQESINNMLKHANAVSANFTIENRPNYIQCTLQDRGEGFDLTENPEKLQGLGMQTIRERTRILHGKLIIDSTKGKGTMLSLQVPKPDSE